MLRGEEKIILDGKMECLRQGEDCRLYRIKNTSGEAVMRLYQVFPGIELTYSDVHMASVQFEHPQSQLILEINHCREGRIECQPHDEVFYLCEGDLSVHLKRQSSSSSYFPLSHYHGISVAIDLAVAPVCPAGILDNEGADPAQLAQKLCSNSGTEFAVIRAMPGIEHIFSELYSIPESIKRGYLKLKVLELLLFLSGVDVNSDSQRARQSFSKAQVRAAKAARDYIALNTDKHLTIAQLSALVGISPTALKVCFKGVFGTSIYAYARSYRMQKAALLLHEEGQSVLEVAGLLGYGNGSKFAKAFRSTMGVSPREYRKHFVQMEHNCIHLE